MPYIKQETLDALGRRYTFHYNVDKNGQFSVKLPAYLKDIVDQTHARGSTLDECMRELNRLIKQAKEATTEKRKVIIYHVAFSGLIPKPGADLSELGHEDWDKLVAFDSDNHDSIEGISFATGGGIVLFAGVFIESRVGIGGNTVYRYELDDSTIPDTLTRAHRQLYIGGNEPAENMIPWTPEAEKFFADLGNRLNQLIYGLLTFLNQDNEEVAKIANDPKALKGVLQPRITKQ